METRWNRPMWYRYLGASCVLVCLSYMSCLSAWLSVEPRSIGVISYSWFFFLAPWAEYQERQVQRSIQEAQEEERNYFFRQQAMKLYSGSYPTPRIVNNYRRSFTWNPTHPHIKNGSNK